VESIALAIVSTLLPALETDQPKTSMARVVSW
jgi:hypothetical protein